MFELNDIRVQLGRNTALIVDELSLRCGEIVGLIGPNGAGKTTLMRLLAALVEPTAGRIERNNTQVAYVGQRHDHRWMPLTVGEVLRMGRFHRRGLLGRLDDSDRAAVKAAAERLEVSDLTARPFGELSGGQRQRVLIASALAADAPCLLLDEPITGLDIMSQQIITAAAADERDRGKLVVLSTHHLEEAATCDRVLVLATELVADGPPASVLSAEVLTKVFGSRVLRVDLPTRRGVAVIDDHGHTHG